MKTCQPPQKPFTAFTTRFNSSLTRTSITWAAMLFVFSTLGLRAGPPFVTDDPEPVDYQHFSDHQHLLFSAGRSIDGPADFQVYIAWQFTFGPEFFHSIASPFRK